MIRCVVWLCVFLFMVSECYATDDYVVQTARKSVTLSGYTRSRAKQTIASEVPGKVVKVHYDIGQAVGRQPFLEIDQTFIDFQVRQLEQTLEKLNVAKARNISQAAFLQKEFMRIDALHKDNVAPLANWEASAENLDQANLTLQATEAEIQTIKIQLNEITERRKRHKVRVPEGWIVVERHVEPGEIIAAGTPVGKVADFTQLVVPLFVSGKELTALQGMPQIDLQVEGMAAKAVLNWVNPVFDEQTRKLAIELILVDYQGQKRGGLQTELILDIPSQGLMVPKAAVTNRYDNPSVIVDDKGTRVPIAILGENTDHFLIADTPALTPGMTLRRRSAAQ